jgi:methionyl-tRNA synthetase
VASEPFIPAAAAKLQSAFPTVNWDELRLRADLATQHHLQPGDVVQSPGLLFAKLPAEQLEEWEQRFGGSSSDGTTAESDKVEP